MSASSSALAALAESISIQVNQYHSMDKVPPGSMVNIRNDMYLVSEGLRFLGKTKSLNVSDADKSALVAYKKQLDHSTKFIPTWVNLPVSTTHVLSSGVAGTMVANHSGLQWATVRNLLMAWVLTLPVSIMLAGGLYWLLRHFL